MADRALALPIMPPERDVAARATIEVFAEYSLAHVIYVCAQPIIFSLLRPCWVGVEEQTIIVQWAFSLKGLASTSSTS